MIPVDPGEDFGTLRIYGAAQPEYIPLPTRVHEGSGSVIIKLSLSLEERSAILDGASIFVLVQTGGGPIQPHFWYVEGTSDDVMRIASDMLAESQPS
jgi:hypothetical protein